MPRFEGRRFLPAVLLLLIGLAFAVPASAAALSQYLGKLDPADVYPGAVRIDVPDADAELVEARGSEGELLGYVYLNTDFVDATGYSGKPIHVLVGIDPGGVIQSARLVEHHEPIVLIGIPERKIRAVIDNYVGVDAAALASEGIRDRSVDALSGATVTVMVIDDSILRSAIKVARHLGLGGLATQGGAERRAERRATLAMGPAGTIDWVELLGEGSARRLKLTVAEVNDTFQRAGNPEAIARPESGDPEVAFIELYAALVSIPTVGNSMLGPREFANLTAKLEENQHAIVLAANGRYSFKGSGYVRGGIFDRFQIIQGDRSVRFHDYQHKRLRTVAADGAPDFTEVDLFRIPADAGFDPTEPWYLELLVSRDTGPTRKAFVTFSLDYQTPERYLVVEELLAPPAADNPIAAEEVEEPFPALWPRLWRAKQLEIAVLIVALGVLSVIFYFQTSLVRHPRATEAVRVLFLIFTLFGIGWYANAQLSVVNIMAVFSALVGGFDWEYFLMEPLIFILWGSVAVSLLFWGRGAYCGWLCPFGALQELMNRLARALKVPQWRLPWGLNERLWSLKYIIFLVLFGVSLHSLGTAELLAEVEPFKTAIILKFIRDWPYVVFAAAMLLPGLFIERFYCRYLCPLGAALAIPARLRMFDWLKRYKQCGSPCQICAKGCMVQAIHPEGEINPNECLYCLHCQELYYDDHRCPVMIQRRNKRERASKGASKNAGEQIAAMLHDVRRQRVDKPGGPETLP